MTFHKSTMYFCKGCSHHLFSYQDFFEVKAVPLMESTKCAFLNYCSLYKSRNKPIWINKITLLYLEYKMGCEKFRVKVTRCIRTINASGFYFLHKYAADKAARDENMLFVLAFPVAISPLRASSIFLQMWSPLLSNQGDMMSQRKTSI